jgi:hypothetical protein
MPTRLLQALLLLASLSCATLAYAQHWNELTPQQQVALSPLANQWDTLPETRQQYLIKLAKHYPKLTPEKQALFHQQIVPWSKLTAEQRQRAREKHKALSKVPPEKREAIKQMVKEQRAASGVAPANPATR